MNRGYVKLWRKSLDAGWIKNHKLWSFWSYCLLKASYKEFDAIVGLQVIHLLPGQFIFGLRIASNETGLSIREIRTILDFLKKAGNLTIKTTNKFSIISITNWISYQGGEIDSDTLNDKPLANKGQHTRSKEYKNIIRPPKPPKGVDDPVENYFSIFWENYPKKVGKGDAEKAWKKIKKPMETLELIKAALQWQKTSEQWTRENGRFVPNPSTYLNQRRWEDEKPQHGQYGDGNPINWNPL